MVCDGKIQLTHFLPLLPGKISVAVDGGKRFELEHLQGKGVGDLFGILPMKHESDVTTHTLTASTAGSAHSSIKVAPFSNPNVNSRPAWS